jgi:putative OPT family oligopeptide transporter
MSQETPSAAAVQEHKPYIPDHEIIPEFSLIPVLVGALLGIIFGASSTYLVLKVGMTISASIPVSVISITLFRFFSKALKVRSATILENNIVQTTGSAGESIAFGVGVTMPALMILGYDMDVTRVMTVACLGGILGILMMIPLRKGLIVKQHGKLPYPEGTACAEILLAGEKGGTSAVTVFSGFGIGVLYKFCVDGLKLWLAYPTKVLSWYKGVEISGTFAPELLGVGYIVGPATGCIMMAGGVLSTLVLSPLIKLFGENLKEPIFPATTLIQAMQTGDIRSAYILYIGAGAVATGGIISVFSSLPLIYSAFKSGLKDIGFGKPEGTVEKPKRTDQDLPMSFVLFGSLGLVLAVMLTPVLNVNILGALMILFFGFLFVTVSSRLTGEIGSSSNPISGMTVSTLLLTCLIFLAMGWTGAAYRLSALSIAAVVCIAASNGGTTSQDLKTGFLVGATPRNQQLAIIVGALSSAVCIGAILLLLNSGATVYAKPPVPFKHTADVTKLTEKSTVRGPELKYDTNEYFVYSVTDQVDDIQPGKYLVNNEGKVVYIVDPGINGSFKYWDCNHKYLAPANTAYKVDVSKLSAKEKLKGPQAAQDTAEYRVLILEQETEGLPGGKYLVDDQGGLKYFVDPGPEVKKFAPPQARLMAVIIDGILTQKLPWILVLIGACISLVMELCKVSALPFAVGVYLNFCDVVPIFLGGVIRWLVDSSRQETSIADTETSPGVLLSSGLIAGGSIAGVAIAIIQGFELDKHFDLSATAGWFATSNTASVVLFGLLGFFMYAVGRQWLLKGAPANTASPDSTEKTGT